MEPFKTTAVFNGKNYRHFGIHPKTASLYGHSASEIVEVTMRLSEDQEVPKHLTGPKAPPNPDYWGWFDNEDGSFTFIWSAYFLLEMCFTYGMKAEENRGRGKAYRLEVVEKTS